MSRTLRVLLLEDSPADAELITSELNRSGLQAVVRRTDTRDEFARALREFGPAIILSDHGLPQFSALSALQLVQVVRPTAPLILVTGTLDEQSLISAIRNGAENLVLKSNLHRLRSAIESALASRRPLEQLSPRQIEVLRYVADGQTTREIAARLQLSVKTVETHRGAIMKRLGIHDVVGLVRYALRVGLVSADVELQ
ncbi:MAG: response regulator transcription factor [Gemmatimonadota bacterium]